MAGSPGFVQSATLRPFITGQCPSITSTQTARPKTWRQAELAKPARVRDFPNRTAPVATAKCLEISGDAFDAEVLEADLPVLVDFYAAWCGPCKLVAPLMDWAASEYEGKLKVVKLDTEKYDAFVGRYGIHGLPTFAVFKQGEAFGVQEGALGKEGLKSYILQHVPELA